MRGFYTKYAMPIDPLILEQDFETPNSLIEGITLFTNILKEYQEIDKAKHLPFLSELSLFIQDAWFSVNLKSGVNLRDREKLYPLFKEMQRLFGDGLNSVSTAYRGVKLPKIAGPTALSETYPDSMEDKKLVNHLENLAYGLRSWTKSEKIADEWASGYADDTWEAPDVRDRVVFKIDHPKVILNADPVLNFFKGINNLEKMFDEKEVVVYMKNPKVKFIIKRGYTYLVSVQDMG